MSESQAPLSVGIDLGTTYSCIAYIDEYGKPVVLKNFEGDSTTPSVVLFSEADEVVVGKTAKQDKVFAEPGRVVEFVKRGMGDPNWRHFLDDQEYRPEEISAYILKKVVKDAAEKIGRPIEYAVITCPAYFGINEREATVQAGTIAGLKGYTEDGSVNIIPEPAAAAFYYGLERSEGDEVVLVYDLGGGTFDVTLLSISAGNVEAICIGGDHELGGKDWDDVLTNYCLSQAEEEAGIDPDAVYDDAQQLGDLQLRVEEAKKSLTAKEKAIVPFVFDGQRVRIELTRDKFNELTEDKVARTIELSRAMLADADQKGYTAFDRILLVGGSTKMPQIKSRLEAEFPGVPVEYNEPDEAVAKGAALFAQKLLIDRQVSDELFRLTGAKVNGEGFEAVAASNPEELQAATDTVAATLGLTGPKVKSLVEVQVKPVSSKSFGIISLVNHETGEEKIVHLIVKNTGLPAEVTQRFGTVDEGQESVALRVMETVRTEDKVDLDAGEQIGEAILDLPPGLPKGSPVEVTFALDSAGLLTFSGRDLSSGTTIAGEIETAGVMNADELESAKQRSQGLIIA